MITLYAENWVAIDAVRSISGVISVDINPPAFYY